MRSLDVPFVRFNDLMRGYPDSLWEAMNLRHCQCPLVHALVFYGHQEA